MQRIRTRLSFANVVSLLALFVALGGSSYAAFSLPKNSVGPKQIRKDAVTSKKVKNGSLLAKDFKAGQLPAGPRGAQGPAGGVGSVSVHRTDVTLLPGAVGGTFGPLTSAFASCAAGEKLVGGAVDLSDPTAGDVRFSGPTTDNVGSGGVPADGGAFAFWKGTAQATLNTPDTAHVFAICVKP